MSGNPFFIQFQKDHELEKIEGYFNICKARGLNEHHGVIIPQDNVKHLMLNQEVVSAVAEKKFKIYAVKSVDQAASLLMSIEAGVADISGQYPAGTLNYIISEKLAELAVIRHSFGDMLKEMGE